MSLRILIAVTVMGLAVCATAGTISYDSIGETGFQWIHAPDSQVAGEMFVQTDATVTFYNGGSSIGTGTWNGEGWLQGGFTYGTDGTIFAQVLINSGTYAGYFQNLGSQAVSFPVGNELIVYDTGGTNPDGSGWALVPEPGTWALFGLGLVTLAGARLRRRS